MNVKELAERIHENKKEELGKLSKAKISKIIKAVLSEVGGEVDRMEEGQIRIPGFGTFVVKEIKKDDENVKRILFKRPKIKS